MKEYKLELDRYLALVEAREKARDRINRKFMRVVNVANREARTAMKFAKTATDKNEILSEQRIAITSASVARDAAIAALGSLPAPPMKSIKLVELELLNNVKSKKSSPSPTR